MIYLFEPLLQHSLVVDVVTNSLIPTYDTSVVWIGNRLTIDIRSPQLDFGGRVARLFAE